MKKILVFVVLLSIFASGKAVAAEPVDTSLNRGYRVVVGEKAPDFTVLLDNDSSVRLSHLLGKVVLIQFTASWCPVCMREMPHLENEIYQVFKSNPEFSMFALACSDTPQKVEKIRNQTHVTYPIGIDNDNEIFNLYTLPNAGVTRNVLVNREGVIVFETRLFNPREFNALKDKIIEELKK